MLQSIKSFLSMKISMLKLLVGSRKCLYAQLKPPYEQLKWPISAYVQQKHDSRANPPKKSRPPQAPPGPPRPPQAPPGPLGFSKTIKIYLLLSFHYPEANGKLFSTSGEQKVRTTFRLITTPQTSPRPRTSDRPRRLKRPRPQKSSPSPETTRTRRMRP